MSTTTAYRSPWMTPELETFRDAVRRFVATELVPHEDAWRKQQHVDKSAWRKAGELGLLLTDVDDSLGGGGGTFAHEAIIAEELIRAGIASFGNVVHSIVAHYVVNHASDEQKRRWLPKMASGEMITAIAMSEPGAGSDLQAVQTRAERDGDHWVLNGSKTFISNGYNANLVCVVAKTDPTARARGISLLMVETEDLCGYRVGRILEKIGQKGQDTCELFFEDCRVPASALLGTQEGLGFVQLMQELPYERTLIAVQAVAAIERAVAVTVDYTKQRKAFGKSLFELQNTRFKLAEAETIAHVARVFLDSCIERLMRGELDTVAASMAKWWTTDMQCRVIDECLQLHGGYGYMLEYPIAQMWADARVQPIYGGANEIMKEIIARSL
jgi:long-chain-acyl-CoA dehydrogenase